MAATLETLKKYLGMLPDEDDTVAQLALDAAHAKADGAGIPRLISNGYYDLFIYSLASAWYDNRSLSTPGSASFASAEAMQRLVNQFVLELRGAKDTEVIPDNG